MGEEVGKALCCKNCIARERAEKKIVVKIVLQYNFCIVEKKA